MKISIASSSLLAIIIAAAILPSLPSCRDGSAARAGDSTVADTSGASMPDDQVVIHSRYYPETLNLITSSDAQATEIQAYIYETLVTTDPFTLENIPWIAEALPTVSRDHMAYEFHLRKEARFSDGKPVTGEDFIFYLKAIKNPYIEEAIPVAGYYSRVDSASLINGDPYRLRVVMNEPYYLGEQFAEALYAFPKHIWDPKNLSDRFSFKELNTGTTRNFAVSALAKFIEDAKKGFLKEFLVGSGPYSFKESHRNDRIALERNPNYWNREHPLGRAYPSRLIWRTIPNYDAALAALRAKDLDVMPRVEKPLFARAQGSLAAQGLTSALYDYPAYNYIGYNAAHPIFRDPAVRRAFAHAIDRDAIIQDIYLGMARKVQSPIFDTRPECDTAIPIINYDISLAATMLAKAGWKDSDGDGILDKVINGTRIDLRFSILLNEGNMGRQGMAEIFVKSLEEIGVDARFETVDWSTFLTKTRNGEYDAYIGGWVMGVVEGDMYQIWHSKSAEKGGSNYVSFRNSSVDRLIERIRGEFDFSKRVVLYKQIQRIIHEEQPFNFLVSEQYSALYRDRFQGVRWFAVAPCFNAGWWIPQGSQPRSTDPLVPHR